jgi:hypothetical protein
MTTFITIAFATCAYLATDLPGTHQSIIIIGNINNGVCDPWMFMPDSHGQRAQVNGHEIGADINDQGGVLYYDSKVFYFVKDSI